MKNETHYNGRKIYLDSKGYPMIWLDGKDCRVHILVWEEKNGKKPKGFDIHHIDHDKGNYSLSNLQLVTPSQHRRIHTGWIADKKGRWIKRGCGKCGKIKSLRSFYFVSSRNVHSSICKICNNKRKYISPHPLYERWKDMRQKCNNKNSKYFRIGGARGIRICERWADFRKFAEDMYPSYREGMILDRIDDNEDFSPKNCHWVTRSKEQLKQVRSRCITLPLFHAC